MLVNDVTSFVEICSCSTSSTEAVFVGCNAVPIVLHEVADVVACDCAVLLTN